MGVFSLIVLHRVNLIVFLVSWEHVACPLSRIKKVHSWEVAVVHCKFSVFQIQAKIAKSMLTCMEI